MGAGHPASLRQPGKAEDNIRWHIGTHRQQLTHLVFPVTESVISLSAAL
jgi:hypothetical protein